MAMTKRSSFWQFLHFLLRFIGLNGLVAVAVAAFLWQALDMPSEATVVGIAGLSAIGLALLGEMRGLMQATMSHRGAAGLNVVLQVLLATVLVVGCNVFAFSHYKRFDWTTARTFTLEPSIRAKLADLRGDTDIIVYLQHVSFGQRVELRQNEHEQAAEKIIVEKVKDLAEQFQELGPNFRVHILDTQKKAFQQRRKEINVLSGELSEDQLKANDNPTKDRPARDSELLKTIEKAPEDSIFFYARDSKQLQRLSFNDIYQLDKKASEEANGKKGNLVLNYQGVANFEAKVFKIEEKKPRIGFAVVHGFLGQDGTEEIGMPGLKDALNKRGFEGRDIVLRKWPQREPAALEHEESRFELLEAKKSFFERVVKELEEDIRDHARGKKTWETTKLEDLNKDYALVATIQGFRPITRKQLEAARKAQGRIFATRDITEEFRAEYVREYIDELEAFEQELAAARKKLAKTTDEQSKLRVDNLAEQRRITDVRDKMKRLLADVDMLVVPRATLFNLLRGDRIGGRVYALEDSQIEAIKDFMKAGKPVLFCLGPMNEPGETPDSESQDSLEKMLASFNITMPNQTVLFNSEGEAMAESDEREQMRGGAVDIPAAELEWKVPPGSRWFTSLDLNAAPPIRTSMRLTAHGLGEKSREGLKIRHPRPVYVVRTTWPAEAIGSAFGSLALSTPTAPSQALAALYAKSAKKLDEKTVFLMTDSESWNEERPFPSEKHTPRYERPKADDPNKGTINEKRRGPFPIGVALETEVPTEWYDKDTPKKPIKVRLAVIGHGGLFIGEKLPPMREKLFLDVSNWLLGRDNLLARDNETWQFPRVEITPAEHTIWVWGICRALPFVFLYIGTIVWLVRRMR